ncbi:MAG: glycine--tRNA ligase subunit beta [Pseudomonadota bacterium]
MTDVRDLLIELGTEELPPKALSTLSTALRRGVEQGLAKEQLAHGEVTSYATPRRLAMLVRNLATVQPERQVERRGPSLKVAFGENGEPTKAALGFARSCGVDVDHLERLETEEGTWLVFRTTEVAQFSASLIPDIINDAVARLPIPKRMRWGSSDHEFVRPLRWLTVIFGNNTLECSVLGVEAGNVTFGHRFHAPHPITISEPRDYAKLLHDNGHVVADIATRRATIEADVLAVAAELDAQVVIDPALLDEVAALTEWPVAIAGSFDAEFLEVPEEALIATMKLNQKYFHLVDAEGSLLPRFIAIANLVSSNPESVRHGNERVVRPRLADAQFFYRTDLKMPLEARLETLGNVVFQRRLGTLLDKSQRIAEGAAHVAIALGCEPDAVRDARRAGLLCKCDLVTEMVGEFPELQGYMGARYAAASDESPAVADAVGDVYKPRFAGDELPANAVGQAVAIADKLDTLTGIFGIGQPPTGDKDPFALRRAALGVLRIIIEQELDLDLARVLRAAAEHYGGLFDPDELAPTVFEFMNERLRAYFADQGIGADVFAAVQARQPTRPLDFAHRVRAVQAFRQRQEGISLADANKRIKNILKQAGGNTQGAIVDTLFRDDAEWNLAAKLVGLTPRVRDLLGQHDYDAAMTVLSGLRGEVDEFFDTVRVMDDDDAVRNNRIALLSSIDELFMQTADISLLQD